MLIRRYGLFLLVIIVIVLAALSYVFLGLQKVQNHTPVTAQEISLQELPDVGAAHHVIAPVEAKIKENKLNESVGVITDLFDAANPVQAEEIKQWCMSRGLYLTSCLNDADDEYNSYDIKTLESLVASGDMRAYGLYLRQIMDASPKGFKYFNDMAVELAAKGSLDALGLMGFFTKVSNGRYAGISQRENELEFIAIYKVAEIRGNQMPMLLEVYGSVDRGDIKPLTPEEWVNVGKRADEIYKSLAARRKELGLDEFDNSVPESVKQYFQHIGGNQYYQ